MGIKITTPIFIKMANNVHNNKYNYDKVEYIKSCEKVIITCPIHGNFTQSPNNHLKNRGCPTCGKENRIKLKTLSTELILKRFENVHGDTYDYSYVDYKNGKHKVKIRCKKHDYIFEQLPDNHLKGQGCPKCAGNYRMNTEEFLKKIVNPIYDYANVVYKSSKEKIKIKCSKHGYFWQSPDNHINKSNGCPKCTSIRSKIEKEISDFIILNSDKENIEFSNKKILNGKEIDILDNSLKIGIEYNGLYWHSDLILNDRYHLDKLKTANSKNIKLIQIFSDEWEYKQDIVKSRLLNILGKTHSKIYARKCIIKEISSKDCSSFLDQNHIQGKLGAKVRLGLYYNDELVSLMTFGTLRKNLGQKSEDGSYELLRFCNKLNTNVVGGASKLLKYFINNYKPDNIISYADRRWSEGNLYYNLGFKLVGETRPNYFYLDPKNTSRRESRFKYRKDILVKQGFDPNKTEREIMKERGYLRIYDCGTLKFEYKKERI